MVMMSWGFMLLQPGRAPKPVTNVRDDKATTGFWRDSFQTRRCLVPAGAFCEPNGKVKPATWNWFAIEGEGPRPLFAFAGMWRRYRGPVKKDGPNVDIETYAFLTTAPNALVAAVNHERMPVLLTREEEFETWLKGPPQDALALARQYPAEGMQIVQQGLDKEDLLRAA
jgi:putative SOS response-associated peptidase YedK